MGDAGPVFGCVIRCNEKQGRGEGIGGGLWDGWWTDEKEGNGKGMGSGVAALRLGGCVLVRSAGGRLAACMLTAALAEAGRRSWASRTGQARSRVCKSAPEGEGGDRYFLWVGRAADRGLAVDSGAEYG